MPFLRFDQQKPWRTFVFKSGVVYEVGPRIHHKYVFMQGLAQDIVDEDLRKGVEFVPDPGQEAKEVSDVPDPEASLPEPPEPAVDEDKAVVRHKSGPWFDVVVGGEVFNETALRRSDAEQMANSLNGIEPPESSDADSSG